MPWFHNNSDTTTAVEVGGGEVVSVQPYGTVLIDHGVLARQEIKKLISKGVLQRTANPNRSANKPTIQAPFVEPVKVETAFSSSLVEIKSDLSSNDSDPALAEDVKVKSRRTRKTKTTNR